MTEFENVTVIPAHDPDERYGPDPEKPERPENPMDAEPARDRLRKLMAWYTQERERQAENRYQMALDEDYYDHLQTWSEQELEELKARGQAPLIYNLIKPTIDWIIGTEKRTRIDSKVMPREDDDQEGAELKSKLLKYLSDVNRTPFSRSRAFSEQVKAGVGWLEDSINPDSDEEILYTRAESWRNVLHDSLFREIDGGDMRYIFRWRWLDLDIAQVFFPDRAEQLRRAAVGADLYGQESDDDLWYLGQNFTRTDSQGAPVGLRTYISDANVFNRRERVKIIECWYRMPTEVMQCCGELYDGQVFEPGHNGMQAAQKAGLIDVQRRIKMRVHVAFMTESDMLAMGESPFRHNRFPFTPLWCYRRARDGMPYGVIRGLRDAQDDYNKRASKSLFLLSTNRVKYRKGAVDDPNVLAEEAARPDGMIEIVTNVNDVDIESNAQLAEGHILLMERDGVHIQRQSGATSENLGVAKNAASGKAILALQEQGSVITAEIFDNMLLAYQLQGEKELSLVEQYYSAPKAFRITGKKGKAEHVRINEYDDGSGEWKSDITRRKADFIVGEQDYRQTLRMAMFETLAEMVGRLPPEISIKFIDIVFSLADIPEKDEVIKRVREINGYIDPDDIKTPEEKKALEDKQRARQEQENLQKQTFVKQLEKIQAEIDGIRGKTLATGVGAQKQAADAAVMIAQSPLMAKIVDAILEVAHQMPAGTPDLQPQVMPGGGMPAPPAPAAPQ